MSLTSFTQELDRLVSNFDRNKAFHSSKDFQESQLRVDFVSPLFEALGWDVSNRAGSPPHLREVVVESRVEEKGHRRRADYTFQVSGQPRLVVETKRPSEDLEDPKHILQLKKYAWNLQVRFAVLTNFLQTKIYAVPAPPVFTQPNEFLLEQVEFLQYLAKPDLLYSLLSKERVLEGALDKYFETIPKHKRDKAYQRSLFRLRGSKMVDDHFLDDLMEFRRDLARDIVQRNSRAGLTEPEVNEAVQRVIDRIVFLRIGEDRGIIYDPTLLDLVEKWGSKGSRVSFYPRLVEHFAGFNKPYNGLLFKPHSLSEGLDLSDEVLAGFIERISVETSPYRFDVIPVEILGSIYERFLGSVVRITPARVKVEEKPEVRKAGGVYYTPKYIVDYIVEQTVGKLLEGRTPEQVAGLRVLDPACGSGSFLLGAFTRIMEYLAAWFHDHPKSNGKYQGWFDREEDGTIRLTPYAKRHILLNNIYGVDIDSQACEVTQLSLYLKLLEGESSTSLREHKEKGHAEAFLPDLRGNIKCGNSLIGTEFEDEAQTDLLGDKERKRVVGFDWKAEFSGVMKAGGFDCVIGNPPWLMAGYHEKESLDYLRKRFKTAQGKFDLYYLFIEKGWSLVAKDGIYGMIVPNKLFHTKAASNLRSLLANQKIIRSIMDFGDEQIFSGATNYSCILFLQRHSGRNLKYIRAKAGLSVIQEFDSPLSALSSNTWHFEKARVRSLFEKIEAVGEPLERITARFGTGVQSGADRLLMMDRATIKTHSFEASLLRPVLRGRDVRRYIISEHPKLLIFPYKIVDSEFAILTESELQRFKKVHGHLSENKQKLAGRVWFGKGAQELSSKWYGMMYLDSYSSFVTPHLLTPSLSNRTNFALGAGDLFTTGTAGVTSIIPKAGLKENILYLLGLLNSRLIEFYVISHSPIFSGGYFKFSAPYLKGLPVRRISFSNRSDKARHDRMVKLVERMMEFHKQLAKAKSDNDKTLLQRQISSTDRQINTLVYDLYGLTKNEITIVEETKK